MMRGEQDENSGTGSGFARVVLILAGVSSLIACLLTVFTVFLQTKNYRKPLLQRHVVRILIMVPIFSAASWASLTSLRVAFWIDPFRDVYEAFTLYTFFQLLVNYLGGERSLIILMHGRPPVAHFWPLNHCLAKVDISDPHTFLGIKRGILQYAYIKPVLALATIILKATGTFKEGIIGASSGYFWTGLIYNVSIGWSLYSLALFWMCMNADLQPFRPMPKFLCIKGIIFASWWQGFLLSIFVWLGSIPSVGGGYTADNLAAAIQDALICFEMPLFALSHWYAFSWKDYADHTVSDARMPIRFALRDAFGPRDLIEDAKETLSGKKYHYRYFDAEDNVMAHEESSSRRARMREGMRYERDGRGKYWIPSPGGADAKQPLLARWADSHARTMSPGNGSRSISRNKAYGAANAEPEEAELDGEEERLYENARALEFGDWNYPVINTHYASREDRLHTEPNMISASTNRAILQPTADNDQRRKLRVQQIRHDVHQHDDPARHAHESSSSSGMAGRLAQTVRETARRILPAEAEPDPKRYRPDQLVDLVVEDTEEAEVERVRARKEGGPGWNTVGAPTHYVQTFPDEPEQEETRRGFNPDRPEAGPVDEHHTLGAAEDATRVADCEGEDELGHPQPWERKKYAAGQAGADGDHERNVWARD